MDDNEFVKMKEDHGGHWGEHPLFLVSDWKVEIASNETRLGYWEWVVNEIEAKVEP